MPTRSTYSAPCGGGGRLARRRATEPMTTSTRADELTHAAIASFDNCPDPRLKDILQSLVRHLHAFASDVQLTQDEWRPPLSEDLGPQCDRAELMVVGHASNVSRRIESSKSKI